MYSEWFVLETPIMMIRTLDMLQVSISGNTWARFLSLVSSKLRLCPVYRRPGYWSNLPCDWLSTTWTYSKQEKENVLWIHDMYDDGQAADIGRQSTHRALTPLMQSFVISNYDLYCIFLITVMKVIQYYDLLNSNKHPVCYHFLVKSAFFKIPSIETPQLAQEDELFVMFCEFKTLSVFKLL